MGRRTGSNEARRRIEAFAQIDLRVEPPANANLSPDEREIFDDLTRAREPMAWLPHEVLTLADIARLRAKMAQLWHAAELLGFTQTTASGNGCISAELEAYAKLDAMQMTKARFLKLGSLVDPKTLLNSAKVYDEARQIEQVAEVDSDTVLLA
ncbi:hypothetical protein [Tateyamaria sp.]|uniref:hypothetical protein n=1 Tax=Tateyamaria sp. TaxID=1929288 RepID=UPI0032A0BA7C